MAKAKPFESPAIERPAGPVPELAPMPSPADMAAMPDADLRLLLERHNVAAPWNELVAQGARYNEQFMRIPPVGEEAIRARSEAMFATEETAGLRRLARRTQERYTTAEAVNGEWDSAILVRIAELDDVTCPGCESLAGFEGTYADHQAAGLPGQAECGGNCRCQLVRTAAGTPAGTGAALIAAAAAVFAATRGGGPEPAPEDEEFEE